MSEQNSHKSPELSNGMMKMSPETIATSNLAQEMAGKIALDLVGNKGMTKEKLNEAYQTEYTLRRNELEHIAGHEEPYAEKQIQSGEISRKESE